MLIYDLVDDADATTGDDKGGGVLPRILPVAHQRQGVREEHRVEWRLERVRSGGGMCERLRVCFEKNNVPRR